MDMYVLLIGLHGKDIPVPAGVFDSLAAANLAAEELYRSFYDKEPRWINNTQIPHDPDHWNRYVFAAVVRFKLNTISREVLGRIESMRDLRAHGMID